MSLDLVVGLSGGLDSTVLLHLLSRVHQKIPKLFSLRTIHVHHGLQPMADAFEVQCRTLCANLGIELNVVRVSIGADEIKSQGVESAARHHRYEAFSAQMNPHSVLVLAHHRDDLLETALLQWIRGAGLEGLSAMKSLSPMAVGSKTIQRWRPLLEQSRQSLLDYAQAEALSWIEDPTNTSDDFARNRIRNEVMPVLRSLRSGADQAMARSIAHLQTARELLELITGQALNECMHGEAINAVIDVPILLAHEDPLAARVLRAWLTQAGFAAPPARRLGEFLRQLRQGKTARARMALTSPAERLVEVLRDRDRLRIQG